jgi:iron complex outermembrane receptor protein
MAVPRCFALLLAFPTLAAAQAPPLQLAPPPALAPAEGGKDYAYISLEELLNKDVTVAATKTRVDVARAPVSVIVLTPEDIRRSGATSLGELLRTVPGLDVLESFPSYISVSARGTSEAFPNNMLVLIDGRRLETQLAGVAFLEESPARLEDIKRIEVVKGPVGALYGTNALAGVISITTFSPGDVPGTLVSVIGGNRDTYQATLRQAGRLDDAWSYKLVGGYSYSSTWNSLNAADTAPPTALRKGDALLLLERKFTDEARLEVEAGLSQGDLASLTVVTNQTQDYAYPHLRLAYSRDKFHTQLTWNPQSLELRERVPPIQPLEDKWSQALNLSVDRSFNPFSTSTLTAGGNLRYQKSRFTTLDRAHDQVVGSVFLQNEQTLVPDRLLLFGALGVSHHPEIDLQFDGNAALVFSPAKDHSLRVSFGRAHRDPSFNENYNGFRRRIGPAQAYLAGRTDLAPESIKAWEVGYHGRIHLRDGARLSVFAEGFSERLRDLIGSVTTPVRAGSLPQAPQATLLQEFRNLDARDGKGFEVGAELQASGVRLVGQYAYQRFETAATGARILADIPRHKVSGGVRTQKGPFEFDLWVHSVSRAVAPSVVPDADAYVLVNPRIGLRRGRWSLSLQAFNAFNDKHIETANSRGIKGETVGRLVTLGLRYAP